ncbi:hypothetical protein [Winogradskyella poriferorum]|uniref:hypothetical protein n=1 Tax=Winogradskyella poriferorum TaxID=307627 RepID=UPI003D652FFC
MKTVLIQKQLLEDLTIALKKHNSNNPKPKLKLDVAVFFLSLFNSIPTNFREEERTDIISLDSQRLKSYHASYNKYLAFFVKEDFIKKEKDYGADIHECKSFVLSVRFLTSPLVSYNIESITLLKKFDSSGRDSIQQEKNKFCQVKRPHLVKFFDDRLTINAIEAFNEINQNTITAKAKRKRNASMVLIKEFIKQEWKYSIKPNSDNRLHTNLTRTPKVIRKHIRYDGHPIVGVDLKTSQPFFLCVLIVAIVKKDKQLLKQINAIEILDETTINKLFNLDLDINELREFVLTVLNKDLYDEFEKKLNISFDEKGQPYRMVSNYKRNKKRKSRKKREIEKRHRTKKEYKTSRDLVKAVLMEIFYSKPKTTIKEAKVFRETYPSIHKIFVCLDENKINFSFLLQHIEAHILLDCVAKEIHVKYPEMPLFSIHDALATTTKFVPQLKKEMKSIIKELTSIKPKIELEDWKEIKNTDNNNFITPNVACF